MTQPSHYWAYTLKKPSFKRPRTPVFMAALFTIAPTRRQPNVQRQMKDKVVVHIYTMEYYSVIERNEIESFVVM